MDSFQINQGWQTLTDSFQINQGWQTLMDSFHSDEAHTQHMHTSYPSNV